MFTPGPRTKKLIASVAILIWLPVYALLAMRVGIALLPGADGLTTFLYYVCAGTLWALPVGLAFPWMHREPERKSRR